MRCWRRRAMTIPAASRRSGTIIMAGPEAPAPPGGGSRGPRGATCPGTDPQRVFTFDGAQFRADLRRSRAILEDATGQAVTGYRAPSFSIDRRNPWAHEVLAEEGYAYSSSVAPVRHDHYGWPESPRFAWRPVEGSPLVELPVTTARFAGRTLAAGGGGFFRLLPYGFSRWAIRQVNQRDGRPAIIYFHPWEIDAEQPRVQGAPLRSRVRHYSNLSVMAAKLRRLTRDFSWNGKIGRAHV